MFRVCDQLVRLAARWPTWPERAAATTSMGCGSATDVLLSWRWLREQHPAAAPYRAHAIGSELPANPDDQRVAPAVAEPGDASPPSDFGAAQYPIPVVLQHDVDGQLLRRQSDFGEVCHGAQDGVTT